MQSKTIARVKVVLIGYLVAWTFGAIVGPVFWTLVALRIIRIRGYERARESVSKGNVILAANHPTLIETFLIPLVFFPRYLFSERCYVWSFPDKNLLGKYQFVYTALRCIRIDRDKGRRSRTSNLTALNVGAALLANRYTLVMHPEAGRTINHGPHRIEGGKMLGTMKSSTVRLAHETGATILPVGISMKRTMLDGRRGQKGGPSYLLTISRLLRPSFWPVIISFGHEYRTEEPFDRERANDELRDRIWDLIEDLG